MFNPSHLSVSRARAFCLAAVVGMLGSATAAAAAQASGTSSPPAGGAMIASASGATVDTTSSSGTTAAETGASRSSAPQSGALTLNSSDSPTASQTRTPAVKASASSQVGQSSFEAPIVGSTARPTATPRALAQIQADGPIVASSGNVAATHLTHHAASPPDRSSSGTSRSYAPIKPKSAAAGATVEINVPGVHVFVSQTRAQRPVPPQVQAPTSGRTIGEVGSPGSNLAGFLPSTPRPAPAPGAPANTLFTSASAAVGGSALLGIDTLFTIAVLLVGVAWRRRSWDLPVLPGQSALLSLALDRPG